MYELSPNLKDRIQHLLDNEPTTDDFTVYTVALDGVETTIPGSHVHELRKKNAEIEMKEIEALKSSIETNPDSKMDVEEFKEWYDENVKPKLYDFEMLDHDFNHDAFGDAANEFHKETIAVRLQFKDEITEHYSLRGEEDAEYWFMESGGDGIPTKDVSTVIAAFDSLANGTHSDSEDPGVLEA